MADKEISSLPAATNITDADLFVLQQSGSAKSLTGELLRQYAHDIDSASINAQGHLILTLKGGETVDAGTLPAGPGTGDMLASIYDAAQGRKQMAFKTDLDAVRQSLENAVMKQSTKLTSDDTLDAIRTAGWYHWFDSAPTNAPYLYGLMRVDAGYGSLANQYALQTIHKSQGEMMVQRADAGSGWTDFEWITPPMKTGAEYRTTERAAGKPVYAKRISYTIASTISTGTMSIPHGITSLERVVRCYGYSGDYPIPFFNAAGGYTCVQQITATDVKVAVYQTEWATGFVFVLDLRYTKTTD